MHILELNRIRLDCASSAAAIMHRTYQLVGHWKCGMCTCSAQSSPRPAVLRQLLDGAALPGTCRRCFPVPCARLHSPSCAKVSRRPPLLLAC
jgi:hypothetical protein